MLCGIIAAPVFGTRDEYRHPYQIPSPAVLSRDRPPAQFRQGGRCPGGQPASDFKTLKELEEILEASLFERGRNGVSLTAAGVAFMRYAGPCVQALRDGVNSLREGEHEAGQVRVGVLSTVESLLIPEVVRRLHQRHSALVVSVAIGPGTYLLGQLRVGELDLVVGRMTDSPDIQGLTFEHLYSESMSLVVRPGHPLLAAGAAALGQLGDYPLVLPTAGTTIRKHADSLFVQCGVTPPRQRLRPCRRR